MVKFVWVLSDVFSKSFASLLVLNFSSPNFTFTRAHTCIYKFALSRGEQNKKKSIYDPINRFTLAQTHISFGQGLVFLALEFILEKCRTHSPWMKCKRKEKLFANYIFWGGEKMMINFETKVSRWNIFWNVFAESIVFVCGRRKRTLHAQYRLTRRYIV